MKYSIAASFAIILSSSFLFPDDQPTWGKELQKLKDYLFEQGDTPEFYQNLAQFKEKCSDVNAQKKLNQFYEHKNKLGNAEQQKSYIKYTASECAEKQDEQLFRKKLKQYNISTSSMLLSLTSQELKHEAYSGNLALQSYKQTCDAYHFIDKVIQKESRSRWRKFHQDHPWWYMGIITLLSASLGAATQK